MRNSRYRLNILAQITYWEFETSLKLPLGKKSIILEKNQHVEKFLKYIEENIIFNNDTLTDFSVDQHFLALLLKIGVVTKSDFNSWIEAICLDEIMSNPSKILKQIDFNTLDQLKIDALSSLKKNMGSSFEYLEPPEEWIFRNPDISSRVFEELRSTRLLSHNGKICQNEFMGLIELIFKPNWDKRHFKFGSGWWLNSIFPVVITITDAVMIYDKDNDGWYRMDRPGIYERYIDTCLLACDTNFNAYNYFVLLCSDMEVVFKKYGNRWYRLVILECWEISFLFRLFSAKFSKPYLELQWYYEDRIYDIIAADGIMKNMENFLVLHTIAITD